MKNLAPDIMRKRLLLEGFFANSVDETVIKHYFQHICEKLSLRMYGEPIVFSPQSLGKESNQGYDAFVPLIDSGISLYVWSNKQFLSCVIYTCKDFDDALALKVTQDFFNIKTIEFMLF